MGAECSRLTAAKQFTVLQQNYCEGHSYTYPQQIQTVLALLFSARFSGVAKSTLYCVALNLVTTQTHTASPWLHYYFSRFSVGPKIGVQTAAEKNVLWDGWFMFTGIRFVSTAFASCSSPCRIGMSHC